VLKNTHVRSLLGEGRNATFEQKLQEAQFNVVDADSSQLRAIEMAKAGESFVLQGPPGTGKSQTITNIIAECMGDGKKVLFVSEKLAALDVVYNKLKQAGLEDFCLQLHSHKANKRDFIQELCRTMRLSKSGVSSKASEEEDRLNKSHIILDNYVDVLHRQNDVIGKSLYELVEDVCADEEMTRLNFFVDDIENKGENFIKSAVDMIDSYAEYTSSIGYDYKNNPWYGYINEDNSYQQKFKTQSSLESLSKKIAQCNTYAQKLDKEYGVENIKTLQELGLYAKLLELLGACQYLTGNLLDKKALRSVIDKVIKLRPIADEIKTVGDAIKTDYNDGIFKLDATQASKVLQKNSGAFARLFSKDYKSLLNEIKADSKNGKASYKDALVLIKLLTEYNDKMSQFTKIEEGVKEKLSSSYHGVNTDWQELDKELATLRDLLVKIDDFGNLINALDGEDYSYYTEEFASLAKEMSNLLSSVDGEEVVQCFDKDVFDINSTPFEDVDKKLKSCIQNFDTLDSWSGFISVLRSMNEKGLTKYIDVAVKEDVLPADMSAVFKKIFYSQWIDVIIQREEFLRVLPRVAHDKTVGIFCDKDIRGFEISKAKVRAKLSALRPDLSLVAPGSAVANLLNEGGKKRRQKPIRTLMSQIRELAQNLKPCFLMSPLSVSTFLTPDVKFDVVVFDEASQIFPQDAIGAIYRGRQLIVVGDSKQMPPSNFFTSVVEVDDMEDDEDVKDFESVLDLCSTVMPQLRLKWHYRSRYEQLIEFSNKNFYEGDLVTFPSSKIDREGIGVDFKYVEGGVFDHKSRTNRAEAEYIVDLIFENIEKYPDRSLGVVAFSISQQDLIERLLAKRRLQDSKYEEFFAGDKVEPFFIKNLETVQGDERDTIIFSVAYGKDKDGKMSQNFGPINKMGGERRLNVAFTRAKLNVQLVASIHSYDINLKNSNSLGARLLRDYIEFAQNGSTDFVQDMAESEDCQAFDFEMQVAQFLRSKGYEVDVKIGASAGSVDIGVKATGSDDYVLAVECDGRSYKSAKNTRDRDRLRASILQRMGWHYHRVWAIDWIKNNKDEKDRLLKALEEALQAPGNNIAQEVNSFDLNIDMFEEEQLSVDFKFSDYETADIPSAKKISRGDYLKYLRLVLEKEAPLSEELFLKRTIRDFDREKLTDAVWEKFNRLTSRCQSEGIFRKGGFMYLKNRAVELRLPGGNFVREIKYIAPEELADGMYKVICKNITVDRMGLYRMLAKLLGFTKLGEAMIRRFDEALALLRGKIDIEGEELSIQG
ncbi:MAG: type III restriction endonuclease subunit R, partial [Clostridia bacterium]|nr:type III restriction endonuclease subunit R [Clostridia bacterium]